MVWILLVDRLEVGLVDSPPTVRSPRDRSMARLFG